MQMEEGAELYYKLGSLSNHEDNGSENVAKKMNLRPSKPASYPASSRYSSYKGRLGTEREFSQQA